MRTIFLLTAVLLLYGRGFAQTPHLCATDSILKSDTTYQQRSAAFAAQLAEFRAQPPTTHAYWPYQDSNSTQTVVAGCRRAVYIIPVVVHIDESGGVVNVSDTQVHQQIAILNTRFEPYGIRFVLARQRPNGTAFTGINRFSGSFDYRFTSLAADYAAAATHYYDPEKYFNIYVVPQILSSTGDPTTISGFNQRFADWPAGPDLVVVRHTKFGDYANCTSCGTLNTNSKGVVLVHEAGHYLGLRELWQGGCAEGNNAATCATKGDLCCDTRPVNANYSCPAPSGNDCSYHLNIADNHENYMDYTGEICQTNFTPDQVSLMQATLELYRNKLVDPKNLNTLNLNDCFASAWFDTDNNFLCDSGVFTLRAIRYSNAISYRWTIRRDSTTILLDTTLTTDTLIWAANSTGRFSVSLRIRYGTLDSATVSRTNFLQVADCGTTIASEQGNWYFGEYAGLKFTSGGAVRDAQPKRAAPNNINTSEGTFSHSRNNGQLLFYGGGTFANPGSMEIYNRNYIQMPSSPIIGDFSATQAAAVVPLPGTDTNQFVLFTVAGSDASPFDGFRASIIDMTLNGGLGDLIPWAIDVPILPPTGYKASLFDSAVLVSEQITVIPKCNGTDFWILVANSADSIPNDFDLLVYSLDTLGIQYWSRTSSPFFNSSGIGQLKASPNGNWLFMQGKLLRFDKAAGTISLHKTIASEKSRVASFSPNSRLLYVINDKSELLQFDLESGNDSLSKTKITDYPIQHDYVTMQLGPDNQIYISKFKYNSLAVIQFPDSNITKQQPNAPKYSFNGPVLSANGIGGTCEIGLPNMRDARYPVQIPLDFSMVDSACGIVTFIPTTACANSYIWNFGDGDSSILREPRHTYLDTGRYTVSLTINGNTVVQKSIFIGIPSKIQGNDTACVFDRNMINYSISNYNDEYTYTWGVTGGTPTVDPSNNLSVLWDSTGTGSITLSAVNPNNGCTAIDTLNIVVNFLDSNRIWVDTVLCSGPPLHIYGNVSSSSLGTVSYLWQFNRDTVWNVTNAGDTLQDLSGSVQDTALRYRRVATQGSCQFTSNVERIVLRPRVNIQRQPQNSIACLGGWRRFSIGIENPTGVSIVPQWRYQFKNGTGWSAQIDLGDTVVGFPTTIAYDSAKYRCTINTPCGTLISDTGYVLIEKFPNITSHPQSQTKAAGDSVIFTVSSSALQPYFTWYLNRNGNTVWDSIAGEHGDTLIIRNLTSCENKNKYRVVSTICNNDTSNIATLTVTSQSDLWAKDGVNDIGTEPNTATANDYWGSPDLWNCWPDANCTTHKSPEHVDTAWNYVRARVRNNGSVTSNPFQVKTYWTLGGFYEQWPHSWHYDTINNGFYDSITKKRYPMGGEIGTVSSNGIAPNVTFTANYGWRPPHPSWYATSSAYNNSRISHPICILSRIESCPDTPFGMTFPEIVPTGHNVINNNNIVTRNTEVYDSIGTNKTTPEWVLRIGNQWSDERKIKLTIDNPVTNFWDLGYYVLQLEPHIYSAWEEGGNSGEGYVLDGNTFYIYDDGFFLDNITLAPNIWGWAHFQFRLYPETVMDEDRGQQMFSFVQYSSPSAGGDEEADGGFNFLLNLQPDTAYTEPHIDSLSFVIAPNPTSGSIVNVGITTNFTTSSAVLYIYDNWGYSMISPMGLGTLTEGTNSRTVNISSLSAGTYTMVIAANGVNYSQTFIVLNE